MPALLMLLAQVFVDPDGPKVVIVAAMAAWEPASSATIAPVTLSDVAKTEWCVIFVPPCARFSTPTSPD
jgi:hypothetical protein